MVQQTVREEILEGCLKIFNERGLKFTVDDLAKTLGKSKKTIYAFYKGKPEVLDAMVDYCFDSIKADENRILLDESLNTVDKLRKVLGAMPEKYRDIDFRQLYVLKGKYPRIYERVVHRLETGWEPTVALIERGVAEGTIRPVNIPVFRTMMLATLEQFFQRDILEGSGLSYTEALREVVAILVDGITISRE